MKVRHRTIDGVLVVTPSDNTARATGAPLPDGMQRIGPQLPDAWGNDLPHAEVAAALRADPGNWFRLPPQWPSAYSAQITSGRLAAYRPEGEFEATVISHHVYARYIGAGR
jgi:hypothetical protein